MSANPPEDTHKIIQTLLRGYQFSDSDLYKQGHDRWYTTLDRHFESLVGRENQSPSRVAIERVRRKTCCDLQG